MIPGAGGGAGAAWTTTNKPPHWATTNVETIAQCGGLHDRKEHDRKEHELVKKVCCCDKVKQLFPIGYMNHAGIVEVGAGGEVGGRRRQVFA